MKTLTLILASTLAFAALPASAHGFFGPRIGIGFGFGPYAPYGWYDPFYYGYPYGGRYPDRAPVKDDAPDRLFVYPSQDQTAEQMAQDERECNTWAVEQSGLDPATAKRRAKAQHQDEYNRAYVACLEGRNYTVK
jgi:hypothetical protein